ncbi:hypothetical protein [uncultured Friedmanniella sp.]|uniref:hypothetical protein n=1 Tax=uncultured Friedmanniella sp. TaxID=335381 RepID=UPI0035CAA0D7
MARRVERLAQSIGLVEQYPGAWYEPASKVRRKRAGSLLVALSISLIVLGVVLLVLRSASAGVAPLVTGGVGLVFYVLITRRNRAREQSTNQEGL